MERLSYEMGDEMNKQNRFKQAFIVCELKRIKYIYEFNQLNNLEINIAGMLQEVIDFLETEKWQPQEIESGDYDCYFGTDAYKYITNLYDKKIEQLKEAHDEIEKNITIVKEHLKKHKGFE